MVKLRVAEENRSAEELIPPARPDGSGIGVNYVDAYLKALNGELEDGRQVKCKRKGLRIELSVGEAKGSALLRRLENGPDVKNILRQALRDAAREVAMEFSVTDGVMYLDDPPKDRPS